MKLMDTSPFDSEDSIHVLTVLSQRLSIDLVLASTEANALADRSVAAHMRLLTGVSPNRQALYTYSPSEPLLVLAAVEFLYEKPDLWPQVLNTFSQRLCQSGFVEKGLISELAARTVLLIARDYAAPRKKRKREAPDMLKPTSFLSFFDELFGNDAWSDEYRENFEQAFGKAFINFTHWIITKDALSEISADQ